MKKKNVLIAILCIAILLLVPLNNVSGGSVGGLNKKVEVNKEQNSNLFGKITVEEDFISIFMDFLPIFKDFLLIEKFEDDIEIDDIIVMKNNLDLCFNKLKDFLQKHRLTYNNVFSRINEFNELFHGYDIYSIRYNREINVDEMTQLLENVPEILEFTINQIRFFITVYLLFIFSIIGLFETWAIWVIIFVYFLFLYPEYSLEELYEMINENHKILINLTELTKIIIDVSVIVFLSVGTIPFYEALKQVLEESYSWKQVFPTSEKNINYAIQGCGII